MPFALEAQKEAKFVGEVRLMNVVEADITVNDSTYQVRFRDVKKRRFAKYKRFHFPNANNNFQQLKQKVFEGFENIPAESEVLDFTKERIEIQFRRSAGVVSFRFAMIEGRRDKRTVSSWFVKGKAEKLFGQN